MPGPPRRRAIAFRLNGDAVTIDAAEDEPLLYVLRRLGDTSARYGCGAEQCGACRVLVAGEPAYACTRTGASVDGLEVETAAGIDSAVSRALVAFNASQCGYCLPGIVTAAEALFRRDPRPSPDAIRKALDPQLCRCGSHPRVLRALIAASHDSTHTQNTP